VSTKIQNEQFVYWLGRKWITEHPNQPLTVEDIWSECYSLKLEQAVLTKKTVSIHFRKLREKGIFKRIDDRKSKAGVYDYDDEAAAKYFSGHRLNRESFRRNVKEMVNGRWLIVVGKNMYRWNMERIYAVDGFRPSFQTLLNNLRRHGAKLPEMEEILKPMEKPMTRKELRKMLDSSQNYIGFPTKRR